MVDSKLFKKYDIRGRAEGENAPVSPDAAHAIGRAFGRYLRRIAGKSYAIVGQDNRYSSPALAEAAIEGLRASGIGVLDIGMVSTPVVYFYAADYGDVGGMMITGSHLAPDQNGFKLSVGARNLWGDDIQMLRQMIENEDIENENFESGDDDLISKGDSIEPFIVNVVQKIGKGKGISRNLRIVIDAGNGTAGMIAPQLFRRLGCEVVELYCEPDGSYPNHQPDPQVPANMRALSEKVREVRAYMGIAFDGDADRMGAVDENGNMIAADRLLALLARDMLSRNLGAAVVADVLSSQVLFDEVAKAGGVPVMWSSGHSLVKAKMVEIGALLGGEMSGHIFLAEDYYGFDDAYLAAGRLLNLVSNSGQTLSELNAIMPTLYSTPEYRPHCPDEMKAEVIAGVAKTLEGQGEIVSVDGVRVRFEKGWGLLRASNTEPVLSLRFEGETEADAVQYRELFASALRQFPQVQSID
jgi:phosphomannomutase/phosphoglucomutase